MERSDISLRAAGLGKAYQRRGKGRRSELFWAVRDVTFESARGQVLGIIGRNGSGKTTLLRMLCQVTAPTEGRAEVSGRISAMLGVGTGMHPMFTGRENVYFGGMMLGLDRDYVDTRMDAIIEFAGIGDFINRPVKTYSSGMRSRLGFAIAAQLEPEILFLDEVLAVGDAGFQQKCLERIREMRQSGSTILLVSHNMNTVKSFCDRVLLLDQGRTVMQGDPEDVVEHFLTKIIGQSSSADGEGTREGNGALRIDTFWFEDENGRRLDPSPPARTSRSACLMPLFRRPTSAKCQSGSPFPTSTGGTSSAPVRRSAAITLRNVHPTVSSAAISGTFR